MTLTMRTARVPGRWPMVGHTLALLRHPLEFLASLPTAGDLVEIHLGPLRAFVVCSPDLTHHVLSQGHTFDKGGPFYEQLKMIVGDGLATCVHGPHRRQRRLLQPAFSPDRLAIYATEMSRQLDTVLQTWQDGQVIDVLAAMDEITTKITARTLFTAALSPQKSTEFLHNLTTLLEGVFLRMLMPAWLARVPLPVNRRFTHALSQVDALTSQIITTYRRDGVDHHDLLSMMLAARDEHGNTLTDTEIRDQVLTFWIAGTETTASLLAWTLHLLAHHPHATQQIHAEVDHVLNGRIAHHDDLPRLNYTTRVLTETLRLYPPGWLVTRVLTTETTLAETTLPAGTTLIYSPYLIHRRPDLYPQPDHFDPDRWLPDRAATLPRGAFIPFGGGTRKCIGNTFALLEATLALATITTRWQLNPLPHTIIHPHPRATLRPHPLRMRLHHRHP
jgi:cytochrome P450